MNRGRLVLQDDLAALRGPTGRVIVQSPDAGRAAALLNGRVAGRDCDRLIVADADPAALNAELVASGMRITEISPERRTLEDVVLSVTGSGSDRIARTADRFTGTEDRTARTEDRIARPEESQ